MTAGDKQSEACPESKPGKSARELKGSDAINAAAELIEGANNVIALTGAGLLVDSGAPDFRSKGGIWSWYDPSVYASLESFLDDSSRFWEMVQDILPILDRSQPNPAHLALAEMEKMGRIQIILSQNIDELLEKAGCSEVAKIHGDLMNATCLDCGSHFRTADIIRELKGVGAPNCPECHGRLKPNVILFNEPLRPREFGKAKEAARKCDVMLVIGTSLGVFPVAELPVIAKRHGASIIVFNVKPPTPDDLATVVCLGPASETIPALLEECKVLMGKRRGGSELMGRREGDKK